MNGHGNSWTARGLAFLDRQPPVVPWAVTFLLIVGIGVLDYLAEFEMAFAFFYLLPVMLASWSLGRKPAIAVALLCALSWQAPGILANNSLASALLVSWNITTCFGIFLVVTGLVRGMRNALDCEHALSRTDSLTGISNRRAFYERADLELEKMRRSQSPLTVACIDLDNFKMVNDASGHATGDALLIRIAQSFKACLRSTDMIARLGGDEFALLLADTENHTARQVICRLQSILLNKMQGGEWPVTFSIGAITCAAAPRDTDEILAMADHLMYITKREGKNDARFAVYPDDGVLFLTSSRNTELK